MLKTRSPDKTLVAEIKLVVADLHLRNRLLSESVALKLPASSNIRSGDINLLETSPTFKLDSIEIVLAIFSYEPYELTLTTPSGGTLAFKPVSGLTFINSPFRTVVLTRHNSDARISYFCA